MLGVNPTLVLLPFAVVFALVVSYLLEHTKIWTDALSSGLYFICQFNPTNSNASHT
ncbi:hypothetical protein NEA10_05100 [Phormidium yuhuli AB48]|uniref:Uncharacterized protein n=1 Tax=Phormidium yuhuli AB48 TaxID=2940671 RepID=A0ABY5AS91_9CYAN|nr:hypothetical protein [Phormidium yuhuli]USR92102.1 hypothetical protein NEA10_05100 [Phormidium yuhuli AB48]